MNWNIKINIRAQLIVFQSLVLFLWHQSFSFLVSIRFEMCIDTSRVSMQLCISFPLCESPHPTWRRGRGRGAFLLRTYMWFPVAWRRQGRKQQIIATWRKGKHVIIYCYFHREVGSSTIINTWLLYDVFLPTVIIVISFNHLLSACSREE